VRDHDVTTLTAAELDRVRRELAASLALARPVSPVRAPILAHISAIDTELARRSTSASQPGNTRVTNLPAPQDVARMTGLVREHQQWSVFWDTKYHLWRVAEDDPDSDLYAESPDAATIIGYIIAHS
jgi:hypothetical protein